MKKSLQKLSLLAFVLLSLNSMAQNQVYWKEGFEPGQTTPDVSCDLPTTKPTTFSPTYFNGNGGVWYGGGIYRTTGTGCPAGNNHVRLSNFLTAGPDSNFMVTPIVKFGIQEFHFARARTSRSYTIWITDDTLASTTNWYKPVGMKSWSNTTCTDTTIVFASASAKRAKLVTKFGIDADVDSIWLTSFSQILPVTFGGISASAASNLVKLNFNIETETSTNSYIIERSTNGDVYTEVGTLKANRSANYSWMDNSPNSGNNFYRIKAVDNNGTFQYSTVVRINVGKVKGGLNVYPNPVKGGQLNIELIGINKGEYKARIYNMNGALVHTATILSEGTSLSKLVTLPTAITNGNYTLEITNGSFKTTKLISVQ